MDQGTAVSDARQRCSFCPKSFLLRASHEYLPRTCHFRKLDRFRKNHTNVQFAPGPAFSTWRTLQDQWFQQLKQDFSVHMFPGLHYVLLDTYFPEIDFRMSKINE